MGWLFGFFGKHQFEISDVSKFHPQSVTSFTDSNCYIAAGGNENLLAYQSKENQNKFFICGLGISPNGDSILSSKDWDNLLDNYNEIPDLNGHFCGVQIYNDSIKIFTDKTGLREIHILESKDGCFFSTRLDWLLKIQKSEIDFKVFSSRWLFSIRYPIKVLLET